MWIKGIFTHIASSGYQWCAVLQGDHGAAASAGLEELQAFSHRRQRACSTPEHRIGAVRDLRVVDQQHRKVLLIAADIGQQRQAIGEVRSRGRPHASKHTQH
ncbi:hypothetical protein ACFJI0_15435 [Hydrogenophaga sp. UC242_53]|uniref:hypothetical protein n=1 Tax=Hydrogenophaga sp. UC242_53 TaxID=3350170 RepID=UPI0036D2425E